MPFDSSRPHPARRYDFWLGGKDNFAADRESAAHIAAAFPTIGLAAIENRRFLQRAVHYLTDVGIDQFLDIGSGLPTAPAVHDIAQTINPRSRVVYVDNDPLVLAHGRALMTSIHPGTTAYIQDDLRTPQSILADPVLHDTLDLRKPVGLLLVAVLHFLLDADDPYYQVGQLIDALPSGSHVVLSHATVDPLPAETAAKLAALSTAGHGPFQARTHDQVGEFVDGLDLADPGLVSIVDWRPDREPVPTSSPGDTAVYGAVARVP